MLGLLFVLWIGLGCFAAFLLYFAYVWLAAYFETKHWPREPQFICNKHGPINKDYVIRFQSAPETWIEYCSICFHEKCSTAERVQ